MFDSCSCELLNFLYIKENTHSPSHKTPSSGTKQALWYAVFFPLCSFLCLKRCQFLLFFVFLRLLRLLLPSRRSAPAFTGCALPLPLLSATDFVPSLRSSLQWAEKHTCQIEVAPRAASHPHQLLSTRSFDPNKFIQHRRDALSGLIVLSDGKYNSWSASVCRDYCLGVLFVLLRVFFPTDRWITGSSSSAMMCRGNLIFSSF